MKKIILLTCCLIGLATLQQAQTVTVDLVSNAASTIDVNYTAQGAFPINIWNNQVLTITWPDVGVGGPGNAVSIGVISSNSGWFFNTQGGVTCAGNVCSQKVISSSNNVMVDLSTTTSVVTLSVSGTGSDNTTYSVSGVSGDLFVNHAIFGNVGVPGTSVTLGALPIELLRFQAQLMPENRVRLDWRTANEQNNDYFDIERSPDGEKFESISMVSGAGDSNVELQYGSWDNQPYTGVNYYRLKQVDFDGSFTYSEIRTVKVTGKEVDFQVYPNPATEYVTVALSSPNEVYDLQLYNQLGQLVQQRSRLSGEQHFTLYLDDLPKGAYWIRINSEKSRATFSKQIVIQ